MIQNQNKLLFWYCLFVISICESSSQQTECGKYEWACNNGQCIATDELCDGLKDCKDGSDETAESCVHAHCPSFAFRCAYGGCVSGTAECNGISECADNSDETSIMCPGVTQSFSTSGNCSQDKLQCKSGLCIPDDNACDGKKDCDDGSDETVELCSSAFCPDFAFRCGYGACINGDATCDGIPDCADGSDESISLCINKQPSKPVSETVIPAVTRPPSTDVGPGRGCKVEDLPKVLMSYESNPSEYIIPGQYVSDFVSVSYKCQPRHLLEGPKTNLCISNNWTNEHPTCSKYCSNIVITGVTIQATCEFEGTSIPCYEQPLKPGTRATIACQLGYQKPDRILQEILVCGEDGEWDYHPFRCEQVCGIEPVQATPFIIGGERLNNTLVPWHVGIYSRLRGSYSQICGGTIINAKVVISAAHCFWDVKTDRPYDKSFYAVAAGKYYRDYYADEPLQAQFLNLSELHVPPGYKDIILYYQNDIAVLVLSQFIQFNPHIKPICIEWQSYSNKSIRSNLLGRVAGWGKTEDLKPSTELRAVDLPTISYEECIEKAEPMYRILVTGDKFCVGSADGESVCEGDSGGGFGLPKYIGGQKVFFLWGIVSNGLNSKGQCEGNYFTAFTNIQYHASMIIEYETRFRPK